MYDKNNIFAKVISGEIPSEKLYEDDSIIAIKDINPATPIHILVIPKGAYRDFSDFSQNASSDEVSHYFKTISNIAKDNGADEYRIVSNNGESAGQSVFHFHTHILSGSGNKSLIDKNL
ncbi:histidine triad nucleotide-binding protein [Rickettsiaceae bacterium]|nr:histidine triad nucleotide-binding protein [Rickettsiaceae bacterium]